MRNFADRNRRFLTILMLLPVFVVTGILGIISNPHPHAAASVPGQSYEICNQQAQYLTSPYTYHALASGSQSYTVAQYETLPGYGTTLPSLPSYIANESASTTAAEIFAPDASGVGLAGYQIAGTPVLYFFEGGSYGAIGMPSVSGNLYIGGSTTGFPEPQFNDGAGAGGIGDSTSHFGFQGTHDTGTGLSGSTTLTAANGGEQANSWLTFSDGTNYHVVGVSGKTLTVSPALSATESGTTFWYNNWNAGNGGLNQLAEVSSGAVQGSTQITVGGWASNKITQPIVAGETITIGDESNGSYVVQSVSGSQSSTYTLTLDSPLPAAVSAGTPIWYHDTAGGVTVQYLNIGNDDHSTDGTITAGPYWSILNNDIHDGYAGGANFKTTSASGIAVAASDHETIQYNCFQRMGEYALNGGGVGSAFNYNQVDQTPYQPDLSGNGQSGCGKWWGSSNNDIIGNAFTDEGYSVCLWFDNGNSGMLVQGNYFYNLDARAIQNETGWNSDYDNNLFEDVTSAIYQNDSGGWNIPGSRYNNQIIMQNNTFHNVKEGINIWGASGRSCLNSGESYSNGESAPYCSGGFPQISPDQQDFSHYIDSTTGNNVSVAAAESCSVASPCSTVKLTGGVSPDDWIGFSGQAPNTCTVSPCGSYARDPVVTASSGSTNVSTFSGSGTITVTSTAGFPTSGHLIVDTSNGSIYSTGAVVAYTGTTATSFTGVSLVSGSGTLGGGHDVEAVQPYQVTNVACAGGNCTNNAVVSVMPSITSNVSAGTAVYSTGTCQYYDSVSATGTGPLAPNGTAYIDGCMWENRNITVTNNTFYVNPAEFDSVALPEPETGNWSCTTGSAFTCATNTMGYQYPGGNSEPYDNVSFNNAMMSSSSFTAPYSNLNASGSPLAGQTNGDVGINAETPYNDVWSNNTYLGDWRFQAYVNAAACPVDWTGSALSWNGGTSGNACNSLTVPQWQQYWKQDSGSTSNTDPTTPTATLSASPKTITSGQSSTLTWNSSNTTDCSATSPSGFSISGISGSTSVSPTSTTTYNISCAGSQVNATASVTVTVSQSSGKIGDFNNDNQVNITDLSMLLSAWGTNNSTILTNLNQTGTVNITCLSIFLSHWGT